MILTKKHVDDFIKCPFLFGKNVLSDKYVENIKLKENIDRVKKHIIEIASYEMQENVKLDLSEYRTQYTNKYFTSKKSIASVTDPHLLITRLNALFSNFSDKVFIGYNIPIDISIAGTSISFRDIIDFGLIDDNDNLTFIEIVDFNAEVNIREKLKNWTHYYTPYSFLASSFNKDVNVVLLDPDLNERIEMKATVSRFGEDYKQLCDLIKPIQSYYLYKNLYACKTCDLLGDCR